MDKTRLRVDDEVVVIAGKEKGKRGKVLKIDRYKNKVLVEGVNVGTYSQKKTEQDPGGLLKKEFYLHLSNVMYWDAKNSKPVRLGIQFSKGEKGKKQRFMKNSANDVISDADIYVKKDKKKSVDKGVV